MKVAVIKIGSRISFNSNDTSGGNGEARSIIRMLRQGGAEVHIYTKILKKDNLLPEYAWHNLSEPLDPTLPGMDALVVLNGNINFFGGKEDREQLLNYVIINSFPGRVFYFLCDPELTLKQAWPVVVRKKWASNWSREQLYVSRRDIVCLSQPYDVKKICDGLGKNEIVPSDIIHFPFEKFPCLNDPLPFNPAPEVDLSYGGTMRGGKRKKKMIKFYFGLPESISVEMFGKIRSVDFDDELKLGLREPTFTGPINYDEMLSKMNKALAHVVIGDPWYEQVDDMAQRAYESIWSSVVTFIDSDLDKRRRVYGRDKFLADFLYVSDRAEVAEKIQLLKQDPLARKQIVKAQFDAVAFDTAEYCEALVDQLKRYV